MQLTKANYYSPEMQTAYWSASFVKGMLDCPSRTMAELRGEYVPEPTEALLVGSYVDAYFEGTLPEFISNHPEIINSRTGELKAAYRRAEEMITRAESDPVFMDYLDGEKQVIRTGEIEGIPFKCKMDVYRAGERIVDLKTAKDMRPIYKEGEGLVSFAEYWNWPLQMAIYQKLEGNRLPCYLAVITKENPPDLALIEIPQHILDAEMKILIEKLPYLHAVRQGIVTPQRCGKCAWCRMSNQLTGPVSLIELMEV